MTEYAPKVIEAVKQANALDADELRDYHYLMNNSDQLPQEAEGGGLPWSDPWQMRTLANAYRERPPREYIAGDVFILPSLNIVFAAPGDLKSFLLQDLAVCVAMGENWLEPAPWKKDENIQSKKTRQCPVIWIDQDGGTDETDDRFQMLGRAYNAPEDTPLHYASFPAPMFDATKKELIGDMIQRAEAIGAKLIIIDNLTAVSGGVEENSASMAAVMLGLRQIAEGSGAAVIVIHHQRKGNGQQGGRAGDALRGHSSIEAALNYAFKLTRDGNIVNLKTAKARGAQVAPFSAYFSFNETDNTARFFGLKADDKESNQAITREIKAALKNGELNQTALTNAVEAALSNVTKKRIREHILEEAQRGKWLLKRRGDKNAILYSTL